MGTSTGATTTATQASNGTTTADATIAIHVGETSADATIAIHVGETTAAQVHTGDTSTPKTRAPIATRTVELLCRTAVLAATELLLAATTANEVCPSDLHDSYTSCKKSRSQGLCKMSHKFGAIWHYDGFGYYPLPSAPVISHYYDGSPVERDKLNPGGYIEYAEGIVGIDLASATACKDS
jgi:hypothetical protein